MELLPPAFAVAVLLTITATWLDVVVAQPFPPADITTWK
jgi:hypothetical protein